MSRDDATLLDMAHAARLIHTCIQGLMDVQIRLRGVRDVVA
jgi:hypothetical protein